MWKTQSASKHKYSWHTVSPGCCRGQRLCWTGWWSDCGGPDLHWWNRRQCSCHWRWRTHRSPLLYGPERQFTDQTTNWLIGEIIIVDRLMDDENNPQLQLYICTMFFLTCVSAGRPVSGLTLRERCSLLVFRSQMWTQWSRPPLTRNWDDVLRHTRVCFFWMDNYK